MGFRQGQFLAMGALAALILAPWAVAGCGGGGSTSMATLAGVSNGSSSASSGGVHVRLKSASGGSLPTSFTFQVQVLASGNVVATGQGAVTAGQSTGVDLTVPLNTLLTVNVTAPDGNITLTGSAQTTVTAGQNQTCVVSLNAPATPTFSAVSTLSHTVPGPQAVAIDPHSGVIWVTSSGANGAIDKFDANGNFLGEFGSSVLQSAIGVAVDSSGNVYVGEFVGSDCKEFDSNGNFLRSIGATDGLGRCSGVAVDASDNIWLADDDNATIDIFNQAGTLTSHFSTTIAAQGTSEIVGIALDQAGNLWVSQFLYGEATKYSPTGQLLATFGQEGSTASPGVFEHPYGLSIDPNNNVLLSDPDLNQVQEFTDDGQTFLGQIGPTTPVALNGPNDAAVDQNGHIFVVNGASGVINELQQPLGF